MNNPFCKGNKSDFGLTMRGIKFLQDGMPLLYGF